MSDQLGTRVPLLSSLRWRLSAAISGVVFLCAVLCIAGAVVFLRLALTDRASTDLRHTLQGVSGYLHDQRDDLLGAAELVAADPAVQNAVRTKNQQDLVVHLTLYYADLNADVLDVIDVHGRVLVRMEDTLAYNDVVLDRPSVRAALADHEAATYELDQRERLNAQGYALRATVPLHDGTTIIGVVVVGRQLNSVFAQRIGNALNASVNLIAGNGRTGTTLTDHNGLPETGLPEAPQVLARIAGGRTSIACLCDQAEPALSGLVPLDGQDGKPVGAVELISPLGPIYDVITKLSYLLLALGAVVVIAGTLLALGIGGRLIRRLLTLEESAARVAAMAQSEEPLHDLCDTVAVRGDDEVTSLARSFSAMTGALDARIEANGRLYEAAQSRVRELTGLAEVARLLTAGASLEDTLNRLGELVCRLVGCAAVAIVLPGPAGERPVYGGCGLPEEFGEFTGEALTEVEGFETATRAALRTGTIRWQAATSIPENQAALRAITRRIGWGGATAMPLRLGEKTIGVLTCFTAPAEPLSESDLSLLATIADQVAVAAENARLHAASRDLVALEERARLARELHDSVTQALFSMTLHTRAAQMALARSGGDNNGPLGRGLSQINDLTQGALAEMRALIFELRPGALAEEGLVAAIRKQAAAVGAREALNLEFQVPDERLVLPAPVEENLYRLTQEALHNTVKHAAASRVIIRLSALPDRSLVLEISDDGVGFDPKALHPGHLGMGTMNDRAHQIGGRLDVISAPGQGTLVRVTVPSAILETSDESVPQASGTSA